MGTAWEEKSTCDHGWCLHVCLSLGAHLQHRIYDEHPPAVLPALLQGQFAELWQAQGICSGDTLIFKRDPLSGHIELSRIGAGSGASAAARLEEVSEVCVQGRVALVLPACSKAAVRTRCKRSSGDSDLCMRHVPLSTFRRLSMRLSLATLCRLPAQSCQTPWYLRHLAVLAWPLVAAAAAAPATRPSANTAAGRACRAAIQTAGWSCRMAGL